MHFITRSLRAIERFCEAPKSNVIHIDVKQMGVGNRTHHLIVRRVSNET